jgi:hypothetical protein
MTPPLAPQIPVVAGLDAQRMAQWAYWSHARRCWTGGNVKLCDRCRQLDADASAEDHRRAAVRP